MWVCASERASECMCVSPSAIRCIYSSFFFLFILHICLLLLLLWNFFRLRALISKTTNRIYISTTTTAAATATRPKPSNCKDRFCLCDWEKKDVYQTSKRQLFSLFFSFFFAHLVKCEFKMLCAKNSNWRLNELLVKSMWLSSYALSQCFQPNNV